MERVVGLTAVADHTDAELLAAARHDVQNLIAVGLVVHKNLVDGLQLLDITAEVGDALGRLDEASVRVLQHGIDLSLFPTELVADFPEPAEHAERILILLVLHDGKIILLLGLGFRLCRSGYDGAARDEQHDDDTFHSCNGFIFFTFCL